MNSHMLANIIGIANDHPTWSAAILEILGNGTYLGIRKKMIAGSRLRMTLDGGVMFHHTAGAQLNVRADAGKRADHHIASQFRLFVHDSHRMNLCHCHSLFYERFKKISSVRIGIFKSSIASIIAAVGNLRLFVHEHKFNDGFRRQLIADHRPAAYMACSGLDANSLRFQNQLIARHHGSAQLHLIHRKQ